MMRIFLLFLSVLAISACFSSDAEMDVDYLNIDGEVYYGSNVFGFMDEKGDKVFLVDVKNSHVLKMDLAKKKSEKIPFSHKIIGNLTSVTWSDELKMFGLWENIGQFESQFSVIDDTGANYKVYPPTNIIGYATVSWLDDRNLLVAGEHKILGSGIFILNLAEFSFRKIDNLDSKKSKYISMYDSENSIVYFSYEEHHPDYVFYQAKVESDTLSELKIIYKPKDRCEGPFSISPNSKKLVFPTGDCDEKGRCDGTKLVIVDLVNQTESYMYDDPKWSYANAVISEDFDVLSLVMDSRRAGKNKALAFRYFSLQK